MLLGWQDSLVYRANALMWALWAVLPTVTLMLVWIAAYGQKGPNAQFGGYSLSGMITYYGVVTALRVAITPNFEWEMATQIRDGKITGFIVRPVGFFGYRAAQETAYQVIKTLMTIPVLLIFAWGFRDYLSLPPITATSSVCFLISVAFAYVLLLQLKFLIGASAFWFSEAQGFIELWNILANVLGGGLLPIALLPLWLRALNAWLPFESLYAFPLAILQAKIPPHEIATGFGKQLLWLLILTFAVRLIWRRGLLAYEAYGG